MGEGFDELLEALDTNRDRAADIYLRLRERIERFFEWRNCEDTQELADIVFDRTAKKIVDGEKLKSIEAYCVSVAKFVLLEDRRRAFRREELEENSSTISGRANEADLIPDGQAALRHLCLERCLGELAMDDKRLLIGYFDTDQQTMIPKRKRLAESLGITTNSLRIRVFRLRSKVGACTRKCCESA
jgi:DNA-directed RNA polymerase specialized sigma24 family protein